MKTTPNQLSLPLFDTTALTSSMGLYSGLAFGEPIDDSIVESEEDAPAPVVVPALNFRLTGARRLAPDWKTRAADNIAAIRLMRRIEEEARNATAEEQERLALFTSFGASDLANNLFRRSAEEAFPKGWETLGEDLEQLASPGELASLARVTQYAHFTPEFMVRAMWRALRRMGFSGGRVLEPGCGTGLFFALMPEALEAKTTLTGVEMDPITARISKLLHPNARVRAEDFTKARIAETYDLVIGNPPFSSRTVRADDPAGRRSLSLHDYFIARSIERLRPGGLGAFITSRWTMDKADPTARMFIATMADLVGAVRLPEGAMRAAAGTDVVVDILVFQKRGPDEPTKSADWIDLAEVMAAQDGEEAISINRHFVEHPDLVLGSHARTSSAYGPTYTCLPVRSEPDALFQDLLAALHTLPVDIYAAPAPARLESETLVDETIRVGTAAEGATIKEGSYLVVKDRLAQIIDGAPVAVPIRNGKGSDGIPARHARIIRALVQIRNAIRDVLRAQEADLPWGGAQVRLRGSYAHFKREFGPINLTTISEIAGPDGEVRETVRRPNLQPFLDDPDVWLVASIEDYDAETGVARSGPIFTERVLHPPVRPEVTGAADALAVALHETGVVDLDRVAELLGVTREAAIAELGNRIFLDPQAGRSGFEAWRTADAYLSGPVRKKLEIAIDAAFEDPRFERNVKALKEALPEDLKPSEITARLGAPWIPAEAIAGFCEEILGVATRVFHTVEIASWTIEVNAFMRNPASTTDWGTLRRHAGELVSDALNSTLPQIYDTFIEDGVEKRVLNAADTEAAKDKLAKIKQAFEAWIWTDTERADRLAEDLQRAVQQPGSAALRRLPSHDPRRVQRHKILRAPEARHMAHSLGRLDLCRSRRRRRENLHARRRGHGAEKARPHHEADDDRARALPRPGGARVPAALPDRQYPGRGRNEFREGEASALPCPRRDGELGLHHHHPFRLQVHPRARRLRTGPHLGRDRLLRRPSRSGRRRGPRLAKAHRADEGGHGGEARGAESP